MIYNATIYNNSWNTKKLKDLGDFSRGKSKHRPRNDPKLFNNGTYPLVQTGDIKAATLHIEKYEQAYNEFGLSQSKLWSTGTLCITIAANIAETGILAYPMCFPDSIVGFTANQTETSELFMHYIFTYIRQSIQKSVLGSIQDNINIEYLMALDFKIPKKSYQDKIVAVLSSIDEKIELNLKICSRLESIAKTLYNYWFVQFDFPDESGKPYRTSGGEMVWNEQLKRKIPIGWKTERLGNIIIENKKSKIQVNNAKGMDGLYPFFTSGDAVLKWNEAQIAGKNCFLNTGGNADIKYYVGKAAYSTDTWCITAQNGLEDYLYLLLLSYKPIMNTKFFQGTGLKHLQKPLLEAEKICIPNDAVLKKFNEKVQNIFPAISEKKRENEELTKLRDWLLPMLMNGQARVE